MNADDIEQPELLQEIPVHPPAVVPVRTVQEAVAAGDLPPLDVDAVSLSLSLSLSLQTTSSHRANIFCRITFVITMSTQQN